jgi:hypothetical protein
MHAGFDNSGNAGRASLSPKMEIFFIKFGGEHKTSFRYYCISGHVLLRSMLNAGLYVSCLQAVVVFRLSLADRDKILFLKCLRSPLPKCCLLSIPDSLCTQ